MQFSKEDELNIYEAFVIKLVNLCECKAVKDRISEGCIEQNNSDKYREHCLIQGWRKAPWWREFMTLDLTRHPNVDGIMRGKDINEELESLMCSVLRGNQQSENLEKRALEVAKNEFLYYSHVRRIIAETIAIIVSGILNAYFLMRMMVFAIHFSLMTIPLVMVWFPVAVMPVLSMSVLFLNNSNRRYVLSIYRKPSMCWYYLVYFGAIPTVFLANHAMLGFRFMLSEKARERTLNFLAFLRPTESWYTDFDVYYGEPYSLNMVVADMFYAGEIALRSYRQGLLNLVTHSFLVVLKENIWIGMHAQRLRTGWSYIVKGIEPNYDGSEAEEELWQLMESWRFLRTGIWTLFAQSGSFSGELVDCWRVLATGNADFLFVPQGGEFRAEDGIVPNDPPVDPDLLIFATFWGNRPSTYKKVPTMSILKSTVSRIVHDNPELLKDHKELVEVLARKQKGGERKTYACGMCKTKHDYKGCPFVTMTLPAMCVVVPFLRGESRFGYETALQLYAQTFELEAATSRELEEKNR